MFWELDSDKPTSSGLSLIGTMYYFFRSNATIDQTPNELEYPHSRELESLVVRLDS